VIFPGPARSPARAGTAEKAALSANQSGSCLYRRRVAGGSGMKAISLRRAELVRALLILILYPYAALSVGF
jgi:hypothetical protein